MYSGLVEENSLHLCHQETKKIRNRRNVTYTETYLKSVFLNLWTTSIRPGHTTPHHTKIDFVPQPFFLLSFSVTKGQLLQIVVLMCFIFKKFRCDRILWRGSGIEQLSYIRGESRFSDHRPVCAVFAVEVEIRSKSSTRFRKGFSCATRLEYEDCMPQRHSFYEF